MATQLVRTPGPPWLLILLLLAALVFGAIRADAQSQRRCGQTLDAYNPARYVYAAGCWERSLNQQVAACRLCQNVAYVGVLAGFTGLAYNINARDPAHYHAWQFVGQTSASYLLYSINTSRGGMLRWLGLVWMSNSAFQAVVQGAVDEACDGPCWSREPATWDLEGVQVPKLWANHRDVQFLVGAGLTTAGLVMDVLDYAFPGEERVRVTAAPGAFSFTYRF